MQDRPDKEALLGAIARFLERDLRPVLKDPGLSFRALIAAHLASTVAGDLRAEDEIEAAQLGRLRALLPDVAGAPAEGGAPAAPAPREERKRLNTELARRIRERGLGPEQKQQVFAHVMQALREDLAVYSPRFDTSTGGGEERSKAAR
jgi:Domain of unknown function (DUF6285)